MTSKPIHRPTLRFRRWSRKAYAAFVSIGRCVTIGCLCKGVANCSLSKQKAAGAVRHSECEERSDCRGQTDGFSKSGAPPDCDDILAIIGKALVMNQAVLYNVQVIRHFGGEEKVYPITHINKRGTDSLVRKGVCASFFIATQVNI